MPGTWWGTIFPTTRTPLTFSTVVVGDRYSLPSASESGQSGGFTEDDPVHPVIRKATAIDFSRAISSNPTHFSDEEWVDSTLVPSTQLGPAQPTFPQPVAKAKSPGSFKSRKCKEAGANAPFPSSAVEDVQEDRPQCPGKVSGSRASQLQVLGRERK
jgi:hypothetical protein